MADPILETPPQPTALLSLPDELLRAIFEHVSAPDLAHLQLTCRRFTLIGADPLLWQSECLDSFRWWDKDHDLERKRRDVTYSGWKELFAMRWVSKRKGRTALDRVMREDKGRLLRVKEVLDLGYDAKDFLMESWRGARGSEMFLAQRYWCHIMLGILHRYMACEEWQYLKHRPNTPNATERSLAALDMFVLGQRDEGDIDDIFTRLDSYAAAIRTANPDIETYTPRKIATTVAAHLLDRQWVGISDTRDYHSLDHMFLGVALFSSNRNSVPLISAIIYCYVVRQFGLQAQPISYPFHVHALVTIDPSSSTDLDNNPLPTTPPTDPFPEQTHLFMDPFNTATSIPVTHLRSQLRFIAPTSTPTQIQSYLSPSSSRGLTIRAAHNILAAPSHYNGPPLFPVSTNGSAFAALLALIILPPYAHPAQISHHLSVVAQHFAVHFDRDVELFAHHVLPIASNLANASAFGSLVERFRAQDMLGVEEVKRRGPGTGNDKILFKIGQVFRHKVRGYLGVIYGWDGWCRMEENWIVQNGVDRLPDGRGQPFYNVLVDDDTTRYVAEENVVLLSEDERREVLGDRPEERFAIELGLYFKRWDVERGVFVSNVKVEYPDD